MTKTDREILAIAIPSVVNNVTVPLLALADTGITGHMGNASYIAAISVGGMLMNVLCWLFGFLRMSTSGLTAQARGRRDFQYIYALLRSNLVCAAVISILLIVLSPFMFDVALYLIDPSIDVRRLAETYFSVCVWGLPAALCMYVLNGWFIGMQNSVIPMVVAVGQNVVNVILSLFFVYALGMKIEGVALGTAISQWMALAFSVFMLKVFYGRHLVLYRRESVGGQRLGIFTGTLSTNRNIFMRTLCMIVIHFFFISAGARQGDIALAVNTLIMQLFTLLSYFMDGFANAGEALVGKAVGAGNGEQYDRVVRHLFMWGGGLMVLFTVLFSFGGTWFMTVLTDNADVFTETADYRLWMSVIPVCCVAAFIWDGVFIGAAATGLMLLSMASAVVVFFAVYLIVVPCFGNQGLWFAYMCFMLTRGGVQTLLRNRISFS